MTVDSSSLMPGDVIVLRTPDGAGWWIRRRALMLKHPWQPWKWLSDKSTLVNHVAVFTHVDDEGFPRGLEGRPSGFGWCNLTKYLADPGTIANTGQPKTPAQRERVVQLATQAVGIPYDWAAILGMGAAAAGIFFRIEEWPDNGVPSHMVCSSSADYFYEAAGLPNPGGHTKTRGTDPQDWADFIAQKRWQA